MFDKIEEIYGKALPQPDLGYKAYSDAMRELSDAMDEASELDPWGLPVKMDQAKKDKIVKAFDKAAKAGENYLEKVRRWDSKTVSLIMRQLVYYGNS